MQWPDSITIPVEILTRRICFGNKPALLSVLRNITDRIQAEEEVRQLREELAHVARLNTMGEMATGLAHELNQPLVAISNFCHAGQLVAVTESTDLKHVRELFKNAAAQAMRAGEIIRRLRAMVSKRDSVRSPVHIIEGIEDVLDLLEPDLHRSEVRVEQQIDHSGGIVTIDEIEIQQVLVNLVRNALDAMSNTDLKERTLKITTVRTSDDWLDVAVSDTGKGVPQEKKDQIFDAFFTTKSEGMGMGLAISRTIIEAHGGQMWMTPNSDRGVTFHITLPIAKNENGNDDR